MSFRDMQGDVQRLLAIVACSTLLGVAGCTDGSRRHVPGVYTGTCILTPMLMVVGENDISRIQLTVAPDSTTRVNIDSTGSWPLTWNDKDYCYDFSILLPAGNTTVLVDGVVGINVDKEPVVQGSVTVGSGGGCLFNLSLQAS
jgi:hypothetical protein